MKKRLVALVVGIIWSFAAIAAAEPFSFSGDARIKYESSSVGDAPVESGTRFSIRLTGEKKLSSEWSLYTRLGAQYATNPLITDFNSSTYGSDSKAVAAIDQYGLKYKKGGFNFTLGRQSTTIGTTMLLYKRDPENIGKDAFVEGASFNVTSGNFDVWGVFARENNLWTPNNDLWAVRTGYNFSKSANLGVLYGQYKYLDGSTTRHWAVDGTLKSGKHTFTAEYTQSDASEANKAYALVWTYDFNGKTSIYVKNFRVEANGDMGGQSEFDNNNRGLQFGLVQTFSDTLNLELVYKNQTELMSGMKNNIFEATLTQTF